MAKKKKEVTNDHLARMVAGGFDDVEMRLSKHMDKGFALVLSQLGTIERKIDAVTDKLLDEHRKRIEKLEKAVF
jgi:hypothetical protein